VPDVEVTARVDCTVLASVIAVAADHTGRKSTSSALVVVTVQVLAEWWWW